MPEPDVAAATAMLLLFVQEQMQATGRKGTLAAKKLNERLDTIAFRIRLPLPSDRSCNQTPLQERWIVAPESYLTNDDPRFASQEDCELMKATLLAEACEFAGMGGSSSIPGGVISNAERFLERELLPESARCITSNELLTLDDLITAATVSTNQVGSAELSVEYRTPLNAGGEHRASNIGWTRPPREILFLRQILGQNGVPGSILDKVQLKAYSTDKQTMPPYFSNRDYRWATFVQSPQFASRSDCRSVELQLLSQMLEFVGAPRLSDVDRAAVESHLRRPLEIDGCRCPITGQPIVYERFVHAAENPRAGRSEYHVGHLNPLTRGGRHDWGNVVWMSDAGNRIQGNDTFDEIVVLIQQAAAYHQRRLGLMPAHPPVPDAPTRGPQSDRG